MLSSAMAGSISWCSPVRPVVSLPSGPSARQVPASRPSRKASWHSDRHHLLLPASSANSPGTSVSVRGTRCQPPCSHCSLLNAPQCPWEKRLNTVWHHLHSLLDNLKT